MNTPEDQNLTLQVQNLLAEAIQVPLELVTPDLAFGDLPQWDSLGHMEVMLRLEEQFGIAIDADRIARLISIPEICHFLEENGHGD
ncbi:MAG: acyl carrier protein [Anaerolineales bacterium]|nr:acyl carrier protein [Anaerolineales bacterium]